MADFESLIKRLVSVIFSGGGRYWLVPDFSVDLEIVYGFFVGERVKVAVLALRHGCDVHTEWKDVPL